jgi:hypothetical protein
MVRVQLRTSVDAWCDICSTCIASSWSPMLSHRIAIRVTTSSLMPTRSTVSTANARSVSPPRSRSCTAASPRPTCVYRH